MFRRPGSDKVGLFGAVLAIVLGFLLHPDTWRDAPAPRPVPEAPAPERAGTESRSVRRPAPAPAAPQALPEVNIWSKPRASNGTGTAFVVRPGAWLTARHVVDGCRNLAFFTGPRSGRRLLAKVAIEGNADLALISIDPNSALFGTEPIALDPVQPQPGATGFHYGFPGEARGRVESTLIGGSWMATRGYRNTDEPVLIWAEVRREGIPSGSLGGMSGGPTLDAEGALVGVTVAESPRRGRVITTAPREVRKVLEKVPRDARLAPPDYVSHPPSFSELERRGFVRRVYCGFKPAS